MSTNRTYLLLLLLFIWFRLHIHVLTFYPSLVLPGSTVFFRLGGHDYNTDLPSNLHTSTSLVVFAILLARFAWWVTDTTSWARTSAFAEYRQEEDWCPPACFFIYFMNALSTLMLPAYTFYMGTLVRMSTTDNKSVGREAETSPSVPVAAAELPFSALALLTLSVLVLSTAWLVVAAATVQLLRGVLDWSVPALPTAADAESLLPKFGKRDPPAYQDVDLPVDEKMSSAATAPVSTASLTPEVDNKQQGPEQPPAYAQQNSHAPAETISKYAADRQRFHEMFRALRAKRPIPNPEIAGPQNQEEHSTAHHIDRQTVHIVQWPGESSRLRLNYEASDLPRGPYLDPSDLYTRSRSSSPSSTKATWDVNDLMSASEVPGSDEEDPYADPEFSDGLLIAEILADKAGSEAEKRLTSYGSDGKREQRKVRFALV